MNRKSPLHLAFLCLATLSAGSFADIVTLKSGTKVEGKITSETAAEITISVKSGGITDDQTIKKSDIASVAKDAPDELAWQPLKGAKLGKNSFPLPSYDSAINPLNGFINEYPESKYAADAKKLVETFSAEKKRVEEGEVKLDDKWLSKEEAQKEGVQIKGLIAFNYMKDQSARDMTAALNTLEVIEKNYAGTRAYPDAVDYAQKMLPALKTELERRTKALEAKKTEQAETIKKLTGQEKTTIENEIKAAKTSADAVVAASEKQGLKWLPLNPSTEHSLQSLTQKLTSETQRLNSVPVAKMRASIESAEKAKAALASNDLAGAETALAQASSAWSNNELSTRLKAELDAAKKAAAIAAATAVPAADTEVLPPVAAKAPVKAVAPVAEEVAPEKPFLLTAGGAITVVLVVALLVGGFTVMKKMKAKDGENLE